MSEPTTFSIPRRRMALGDYSSSDSALITLRSVGIINSGVVSFPREEHNYQAVDLSGGECLTYVADSNPQAMSGTLTVEMMSNVAANLGVMLSSAVTTVASAAATTEVTADDLVAGDVVKTQYLPDSSTIVITDSDGTPATLVLGTNYEFEAKKAGLIRFIDVDGFTQPFNIDYTKVASKRVSPMSDMDNFYYVVMAGGNERNSCGGESEVFYRCQISEAQTKQLHSAAEQKDPIPMTVVFRIDRDPNRSYAFGPWDVTEAA